MSETQILRKLTSATIKVSSDDGHRIVTPSVTLNRKQAASPKAAAQVRRGPVPIQTAPQDVKITGGTKITHVTSSSSSQRSEINGAPPVPPAVAAARASKAAAAAPSVSDHLPDYVPPKTPKNAAGATTHPNKPSTPAK